MTGWEIVVGIETHVELSTKSKIFCGCTTEFEGAPNTHCCPICAGFPGVLPRLNEKVVDYAVLAGLAMNCEINLVSKMDRKNYVYPDLPKAYQISQYDQPICTGGWLEFDSGKRVGITRIHIEEDPGKLIHDRIGTLIDYNRSGIPLIEIVSEPDLRGAAEAREYAEKLRMILKTIGVSDCRMQEGSMRCDVNVSVRRTGSAKLGTRTETKNMNSFAFLLKAVEYESARQIELIESGGVVVQETLRWNPDTGETEIMRDKEDAHDYRYFPEPDLAPIVISAERIGALRISLPELPDVKLKRYIETLDIPPKDAALLVRYPGIAAYFEQAAAGLSKPKIVSNFLIGQIFRRLEGDDGKERAAIAVPPEFLGELTAMIESEKISMNVAKNALERMLDTGFRAADVLSPEDIAGFDAASLDEIIKRVIGSQQAAVKDYLTGKEKALKALVGGVMKETRGKADAQAVEAKLMRALEMMK